MKTKKVVASLFKVVSAVLERYNILANFHQYDFELQMYKQKFRKSVSSLPRFAVMWIFTLIFDIRQYLNCKILHGGTLLQP